MADRELVRTFEPKLITFLLKRPNRHKLMNSNLILKNGKPDRCLFNGGYCSYPANPVASSQPTFHYYTQDHLGNNRTVVNENGTLEQVTHYYPFGGIFGDATLNAGIQPYKYNCKEFDRVHGLNTYDYGARQYDPILLRWDRIDPLAEKYYPLNPYNYCGNSPIRHIDPNGRKVYGDSISQEIIRYTLSDEESKYVKFDSDGQLNYELLCQYDGNSAIMEALTLLAKSEVDYLFESKNCDNEGTPFADSDNTFYRGVTEMPGANTHPSLDGKVHAVTGNMLSRDQKAKTLAHEGYGHSVIYELTRNPDAASHHYKNKQGNSYMFNGVEYFDLIRYDSNEILNNQINRVVNETIRNINKKRVK